MAFFVLPTSGEPDHRPLRDSQETAVATDDNPATNSSQLTQTEINQTTSARGTNLASSAPSPSFPQSPDAGIADSVESEPANDLSQPARNNTVRVEKTAPIHPTAPPELTGQSKPPNLPESNLKVSENDAPLDQPVTELSENKTKSLSVRERIQIRIHRFRQPEPVALRELIRTIEQMCRVRVDVYSASKTLLTTSVSLSLENTTPADILTEAGRKCGLRVIIDEDSVRMISDDH